MLVKTVKYMSRINIPFVRVYLDPLNYNYNLTGKVLMSSELVRRTDADTQHLYLVMQI